MKRSILFQINNSLIFYSLSQTVSEMWIATDPFIILPESTNVDEIYNSLISVLNASKKNVIDQKDFKKANEDYFKKLKVKSKVELYNYTLGCLIEMNKEFILFYPYKSLGPKGGLETIRDSCIKIELNSNPLEVVNSLKEAIKLSIAYMK